MKRKSLLLIFLMTGIFLFASEKNIEEVFYRRVSELSARCDGSILIKKIVSYAVSKQYDSVIVEGAKAIAAVAADGDCRDLLVLLRAVAFKEKKIHDKARSELAAIRNKKQFAVFINNFLGEIAFGENDYQKAIDYFKAAEGKADMVYINKGAFYNNLGISYLHLSQFNESEAYLFKALAFFEEKKDSAGIIISYTNIANFYYGQYKDNLAIPFFEKSYALSLKVNDFNLKRKAAKNMAVMEENRGDLKKSLQYRKESEVWTDSLNNQNKIWEIAELEKKFEVDRKQKEIDLLAARQKAEEAERNTLLVVASLLLLLLLSAVYFYRQKVRTNRIITEKNKELDSLNATKDKLFSIVSHDLRSSVNSLKNSNRKIQEKLEQKNLDEMDQLLERNVSITNNSYTILDNLLHWAQQQTGQLYFQKEKLNLKAVTGQVAYNFRYLMEEKKLRYTVDIPSALSVQMDLDSLKIILRNLFDNAIKYNRENGAIHLSVEKTVEEGFVTFQFADEGLGMSAEKVNELLHETVLLNKKDHQEIIGTGLGFQLCRSMLKQNGGRIHAVSSIPGKGSTFVFLLPNV